VHDNVLTIGAVQDRRLRAVRVLPLPSPLPLPLAVTLPGLQADGGAPDADADAGADTNADVAWLVRMLAREALLLDLAPPARLQLCGQVPPAWLRAASGADAAAALQVGVLDLSQRTALDGAPGVSSAMSPAVALVLCGSRA
jgi:hypothetical protein